MHWVVQENLYSEEGFASLLRALEVMGLPHSVHKVVPFVHTLEPEPTLAADTKVIALGAYTMISIARARGWSPGTYELGVLAELPAQLPYWGERLLNADAWVGRLGDVKPLRQPSFVRPIRDSKVFSGKVLDWDGLCDLRDSLRAASADRPELDDRVLVAPLKRIFAEYRTWVVGGKVVSASQYKLGSAVLYDANVPPGILAFAQECVDIGPPLRAYVLDVASTPDGLRIVETNTLNAAGWYKGNVGRIVAALEDLERA